jgi:hypothetical protein
MTKSVWAWTWFAFLLALDIAIPWFGLPLIEEWRGEPLGMSGAFLFWTVWAAAAIISAFIILLKWRGVER